MIAHEYYEKESRTIDPETLKKSKINDFPELGPAEASKLKKSLEEKGQYKPVFEWRGGVVVGWNTAQEMKKLKKKVWAITLKDSLTKEQVQDFCDQDNILGRNLGKDREARQAYIKRRFGHLLVDDGRMSRHYKDGISNKAVLISKHSGLPLNTVKKDMGEIQRESKPVRRYRELPPAERRTVDKLMVEADKLENRLKEIQSLVKPLPGGYKRFREEFLKKKK